MTARRTVDLLPEIFRTPTNQKFLAATLDQLTQEPEIQRTQGYVGRRIGPGVNPKDNYVREPDAVRADYQLEPGVVFLRPDTNLAEDAITYPGIIDSLGISGADTQKQDRLFQSEYYSWDPFCDLDKFTNYSQYYWLPQGPDTVDVTTADTSLEQDFSVSRIDGSYTFSNIEGKNPFITLVRGGSYQFEVDQPGSGFWIQTEPGVNGRLSFRENISSRDVLGVTNNGATQGTVTFDVPLSTAQDFFYNLPDLGPVDLATDLFFNQINNRYVDVFLAENPNGIDGITNLDGRTLIFLNKILDPLDGGWQLTSMFDLSVDLFDQATDLDFEQRYSVWRVQYIIGDDDRPYMVLNLVRPFPVATKTTIQFGQQLSNVQFFRNTEGFFERIPLLTALIDTLWYQDATDPGIFGQIKLISPGFPEPVKIDEIIGAQNYRSPNGVVFTNGLKIKFIGSVSPVLFQDREYYVEGVGTGPGINFRVGFIDGEAYFGPFYNVGEQKVAGRLFDSGYKPFIYDTVVESLNKLGTGISVEESPGVVSFPDVVNGNGIRLVPVDQLVTPEPYVRDFSLPGNQDLDIPTVSDYITVNRSSSDRNAWSRSNRWFHVDVIKYSAARNNVIPLLDNRSRGKRPIVEFRANLRLYEFGTQAKSPVDIIDFSATDALSNISGSPGYSIDGYTFVDGTRVIFAADLDPDVRNRVYTVSIIDPDGLPGTPAVINLVSGEKDIALLDQTVVCLNGVTQKGRSFWFDGTTWKSAQQKNNVNQAPLFDVYDSRGRSFGDQRFYPSSTFQGNRLFGYALGGTQITDDVLGFSLKYLNINNVGDIVFQNYLYTDSFLYVEDRVGTELAVSSGFARQYINRTDFGEIIGWLPAAAENRSRQIFRFTDNSGLLVLDVPVAIDSVYPSVQIFMDGKFVDPDRYSISVQGNNTFVDLFFPVSTQSVIEARVISDVASATGFYQIPINLENNALNQNSKEFTLGTIRTHFETIGQNLLDIQGPIVGANNTRDLGNISRYGQNIIQNSSPLTLAGVFLRDPQFEIVQALKFNSQEYEKYKARLINEVNKGDFLNLNPTQILDIALQELGVARDENSPFYWSDMIPSGETYREIKITYGPISIPVFDTQQTYDFSSSNFLGLLVFVNQQILTRGIDYITGDGTPTVTITRPLVVGDVIVIREYPTTYGSFVPNTPTKMGLYPAYVPEIYLDESYINPRLVIRGHDGSITLAYNDDRDQVLLEFETRIYNNIKINSPIPLQATEVIPGQWRSTDYDLNEINQILSEDFLSWVGWNKIDYTTQNYIQDDPFTYNYSQSSDRISRQPLLGAWRGIYQYLYDTTAPNTRPWEMLGISEKPTWWEDTYGPAPYTSGNLVLWHDLSQGIIRDPRGEYVAPRYRRPDLITNAVKSIRVVSGGSGYSTSTQISIDPPPQGIYSIPAQLGNPVIVNGVIISIPVINAGRGYVGAPTVTVRDNSGTGAVLASEIDLEIVAVPSGTEGALLPPLDTIVGNYDITSFRRSWTFGDGGPAEFAWRTSSSWPFAVMRLLALTKPAKFFSLFVDRDRYVFNDSLSQFVWDLRYRLDANNLAPLYGDGTSRASYINWIIDYNRQLGTNSTKDLERKLSNLDLRLCWRTASFTDKKFLKIFTERSTPTSVNTSLLLPDESYALLLYQNPAFQTFQYSSVIIQKDPQGYAVLGYSSTQPYFSILTSRVNGITTTLSAGDVTVTVPTQYSDNVVRVPYGYVFRNRAAVCDFLISYGELLVRQGMRFEGSENGYVMDWPQMAQEFLYWSTQGWIDGSLINLNPASTSISITRPGAVAESLSPPRLDNIILNQNRQAISPANLVIDRIDNTMTLTVSAVGNDTINYFSLRFISYEHIVILDNRSIFSDLIYDPSTGARQSRILISGALSGGWNGTVNAPGFVLNQDNIRDWSPKRVYAKGDIVRFKDDLWTASSIIQPAENFDYTVWLRSDYDEVQRGLLPNAAASSDLLASAYDVYNANLEREIDLFSYGLIGFRPRQYMTALNLDDVSQVNLYQQFLGTKGTRRSLEIFSLADLGKELAEYNVYEYWAIRKAQYGANANRSYFEISLDPALLTSNPSIVSIINPGQISIADQTVFPQDLWSSSYRITDPDILPTRSGSNSDRDLPSAGYVNLDDVDFSVFDIGSLTAEDLDGIGIGTTIWVAASGDYDWDVYRVEKVPATIVTVSDNLDGTSLVTFDGIHGLTSGELLLIKFFSPLVNGSYSVLSTPSLFTVTIGYQFRGFQTTLSGTGLALRLETARVTQASDIINLPYAESLDAGDLVWVDQSPQGSWIVLEKTQPFRESLQLSPQFPLQESGFGTSLAQGFFNLSALVGAPGYVPPDAAPGAPSTGAVYGFVRSSKDIYEFIDILTLTTTGIAGYGNSIDIGEQQWAVVGASKSNNQQGYASIIYRDPGSSAFDQRMIITAGDQDFGAIEFGYSVAISLDENWIYVGAPGVSGSRGAVYVYSRVDVQSQSVEYLTLPGSFTYNYSDHIKITDISITGWQFVVLINNILLTPGVDYQTDSQNIILLSPPLPRQRLLIARRNSVQLDQQTYRNVSGTTTGSGTDATFLVNRVRGTYVATIQNPGQGYTVGDQITIPATDINPSGYSTLPSNDLVITVTATSINNNSIQSFTQSGSGTNDTSVFNIARFFAQITDIWSFSITVNGAIQRPYQDYIYDSGTGSLTFLDLPPPAAIITVSAQTYFDYVTRITDSSLLDIGDRFGTNITTTTDGKDLIIGAPGIDTRSGKAFVYHRTSESFQVTSLTNNVFNTQTPLISPVLVSVKGKFLLQDTPLNFGGEFTITGANQVTISSDMLSIGDIVEISTNEFRLSQQIESQRPSVAAGFGEVVDQCVNDCSLYISSPRDSTVLPQAGSVELWQNQARLYGTITSLIANPVLTPGNYISVNGFLVRCTGTTVEQLAKDINGEPSVPPDPLATPAVPNVKASTTADLEITADGFTSIFQIGDIYSDTIFVGSPITRVLLDDVEQIPGPGQDYVYDDVNKTLRFASIPVENSRIKVISGRITISALNIKAAPPLNKVNVQPGPTGDLFDQLGFQIYQGQQIIKSPSPQDFAKFGSSISISNDTLTLAVGSPGSSAVIPTLIDRGTMIFDAGSTGFFDSVYQSGEIYMYDFLPAYQESSTNPGRFVFGQNIYSKDLKPFSKFGSAVDLTTGILLGGAPTSLRSNITFVPAASLVTGTEYQIVAVGTTDFAQIGAPSNTPGLVFTATGPGAGNGVATPFLNTGSVLQFSNPKNLPSWSIRRAQAPVVDVDLLNTLYIYDYADTGSAADYLDYFDPLQGRLLGVVAQNIDYIGSVDPANYNIGPVNNRGSRWAQESVGQIWWDTSRARFVDPSQGDLDYAANQWGQLFPGSEIEIYQWISSSTPPQSYVGPGRVRNTESYVLIPTIDQQGMFIDTYYFWISDSNQVVNNKTLSIETLSRYIENPRGSGIAYLAPLSPSTVALYNCEGAVSRGNSVLHIEFDRVLNDSLVHTEFQLIAQDRAESFLNSRLYVKLLDSFCGQDSLGAQVPDPFLSPSEKYGVSVRPRQSMFVNRFDALENYLESANLVLARFPVSENRSFRLLDSNDPEPPISSKKWDKRVANDQELGFQDLAQVPQGYRYLVASDQQNRGLWSIYQVIDGTLSGSKSLFLIQVQNFDTRLYWSRINWYRPGYDPSTPILVEVPVSAALASLTVPQGSSVKVTANNRGRWEIYQLTNDGWVRVALQDGTIKFSESLYDYQIGRFGFDGEVFDSQYFDQAPGIETRQIIEAINQELLINDLLIERNRLLILMFNYILSEQLSPDWLTKTSLIDVDHTIRNLQPFQVYRQDNQDFVLQYIQEVKPYHTQIRKFGLIYRGQDQYLGSITDFDIPAYWDPAENLFISPVLDNVGNLSTTSSTPSDAAIWSVFPWNQWFQNYDLGTRLVRGITTTIRYDRYQYQSDIVPWISGKIYVQGDLVRYADRVWRAVPSTGFSSQEFNTDQWEIVPAGDLTGVDRTMGYYVPGPTQPGLDLAQLISGVDYPGVQVQNLSFDYNAGFDSGSRVNPNFDPPPSIDPLYIQGYRDVGWSDQAPQRQDSPDRIFTPKEWCADRYIGGLGFDTAPFDNISFGPEGRPTYDPAVLDAIYKSEFTDPYLGILPAPAYSGDPPATGPNPIIVDGGAFVDTYSSHAPEELIPGAEFDTLDLRVYTTPGADWTLSGHGFPISSRRYNLDILDPVLSYASLLDYPVSITVFNATTGDLLVPGIDYDVDWIAQTVTVISGAVSSDIISISVAALGGGNQIFIQSVNGGDIGLEFPIPRQFSLIQDIVIFVNGERFLDFSYQALLPSGTVIEFDDEFLPTDKVTITVFGSSDIDPIPSWSLPIDQIIVSDSSLDYVLTNDLGGTNAVDVIVTVNGKRARPYNNVRYLSDGTTVVFVLPVTTDLDPDTIPDTDVSVYVDNVPQILGIDFIVDPPDSSERTLTLLYTPPNGARVLVSVSTGAQYRVVGDTLSLLPSTGLDPAPGSIITVTTFNDTSQQNISTQVYIGPNITPGTLIPTNSFALDRFVPNPDRIVVTLDGKFLSVNTDYILLPSDAGSEIFLLGPLIGNDSVLAVTIFNISVVPGAIAFRIFQDMRGLQSLYRITESTSTALRSSLSATADVIEVVDVNRLDQPNLVQGIFGLVTIDGERISYRYRDIVTNTLSGLRRGTAGTAAADHAVGSAVLSLGSGNLLPAEYQRRVREENFLGNGTDTLFQTEDITIDNMGLSEAIEVYVGGIRQQLGLDFDIISINPVAIEFTIAPESGYQVTILVQQAQVMYEPGFDTPSDGVPLQETDTKAARFIRGG